MKTKTVCIHCDATFSHEPQEDVLTAAFLSAQHAVDLFISAFNDPAKIINPLKDKFYIRAV